MKFWRFETILTTILVPIKRISDMRSFIKLKIYPLADLFQFDFNYRVKKFKKNMKSWYRRLSAAKKKFDLRKYWKNNIRMVFQVNGTVLQGRCHLNASALIKGMAGPSFKVVVLRWVNSSGQYSFSFSFFCMLVFRRSRGNRIPGNGILPCTVTSSAKYRAWN